MTSPVTIVDYGSGNLLSVCRGLEHSGAEVELTGDGARIANAERLVLPGVGAFGKAAQKLSDEGLIEPIFEFSRTERPFLGICVGMQLMLDHSEEFGSHDGFGLIPGRVVAIPDTDAKGVLHPVPHIGWNAIKPNGHGWSGTPLQDVEEGDSVYFVHSFMAEPKAPEHMLAVCDYNGRTITGAIVKDNMIGFQFHPEKSGPVGLAILHNFLRNA